MALRAAATVLGLREVVVLSYLDGAVDEVDSAIAIRDIVSHIRRIRPHVVVTFGPEGAYGHPDHIAISQFTTAATVCAADCRYRIDGGSQKDSFPPHRVAKLHYLAWRNDKWEAYQAAFHKLTSMVDGVQRQATPWPNWAVTTEMTRLPRGPSFGKQFAAIKPRCPSTSGWKISQKNSKPHCGAHSSSIASIARSVVDENWKPIYLKDCGEQLWLLVLESKNSGPAPLFST
jgi:LmbE family N-acetylglucosaminyl deacetylase